MKGEGVPVESLNTFILTGGALSAQGKVTVPTHFKDGVWSATTTPQKARFTKFTLDNMTGTNNGNSLTFNSGKGCVIKAEIFLQLLEKIDYIKFTGTGLTDLTVNVLKKYPAGEGDTLINGLNLNNYTVNIPASSLTNDTLYLHLVSGANNVTVTGITIGVKTEKLSEGQVIEIGTNNVPNQSTITGSNATDAFEALKSQVEALTNEVNARKFPVGFIFHSQNSANPNTYLGYGTWVREAEGRVLVGQSQDFPAGTTGGNKEITLAVNQLPSHKHNVSITSSGGTETSTEKDVQTPSGGGGTSGSGGNGSTGSDGDGNTGDTAPGTNSTGSHKHLMGYITDGTTGGATARVRSYGLSGNEGNSESNSAGTHSHTVNNHTHTMPSHTHTTPAHTHTTPNHTHVIPDHKHSIPNHSHTVSEDNVGSAAPVNIMPPYVVVYIWKRTA